MGVREAAYVQGSSTVLSTPNLDDFLSFFLRKDVHPKLLQPVEFTLGFDASGDRPCQLTLDLAEALDALFVRRERFGPGNDDTLMNDLERFGGDSDPSTSAS